MCSLPFSKASLFKKYHIVQVFSVTKFDVPNHLTVFSGGRLEHSLGWIGTRIGVEWNITELSKVGVYLKEGKRKANIFCKNTSEKPIQSIPIHKKKISKHFS